MWNIFRYGPNLKLVRLQVKLSWPLIKYGKKLSALPILKWIIHPFFKRPHNELTSIPIHVNIESPDSVALSRKLVERLVSEIDDIFLMDECHCAGVKNRKSPRLNTGCMAFGPSTARIHPSHGRRINSEEAIDHVRKAADEGLVANIAHVWIDAMAFQLTNFNRLLFMCFCDDDQCIYRSFMKRRGPSLDKTYKKLPGLSVQVEKSKCTGCQTCVENCFLAAIDLQDESAVIGADCRGCGLCVDQCPNGAISLIMEDEEKMFNQLLERVREISDLPLRIDQPQIKN
ncbi:4Fe-4S binding protein [bacterium]|nr:4Fe-4S binding protein [bacterium]